jgi:protein disulfide-isomerase A1
MPLVVEFNEETAPKIFKRSLRTHLIMFVSKTSSSFDKRVTEFRQVAQSYRGKVYPVSVDELK